MEVSRKAAAIGLGEGLDFVGKLGRVDTDQGFQAVGPCQNGAAVGLPVVDEGQQVVALECGGVDGGEDTGVEALGGGVLQRRSDAHRWTASGERVDDGLMVIQGSGSTDDDFVADRFQPLDRVCQVSESERMRQGGFVAAHASGLAAGQDDAQKSCAHQSVPLEEPGCLDRTSSTHDRARIIVGKPIVGADTTAT